MPELDFFGNSFAKIGVHDDIAQRRRFPLAFNFNFRGCGDFQINRVVRLPNAGKIHAIQQIHGLKMRAQIFRNFGNLLLPKRFCGNAFGNRISVCRRPAA